MRITFELNGTNHLNKIIDVGASLIQVFFCYNVCVLLFGLNLD